MTTETKISLALIGPPTSAKSSISLAICRDTGATLVRGRDILPQISRSLESSRALIPDLKFVPALEHYLNPLNDRNVVLDNIPRTTRQADTILNWSTSNKRRLAIAQLKLSEIQVIERVSQREVCPRCGDSFHPLLKPSPSPSTCPHDNSPLIRRAGDGIDTVRKGYAEYSQKIIPLARHLKSQGVTLIELDTSGTVEQTRTLLYTALLLNPVTRSLLAGKKLQ